MKERQQIDRASAQVFMRLQGHNRKGNPYNNAFAENLFCTLKRKDATLEEVLWVLFPPVQRLNALL